jgi:hypothetical protein
MILILRHSDALLFKMHAFDDYYFCYITMPYHQNGSTRPALKQIATVQRIYVSRTTKIASNASAHSHAQKSGEALF